jgi:pimeloyl-ACP methyl ester carboxylesterase
MRLQPINLVLAIFIVLAVGIRPALAQGEVPRFEPVSCDAFDRSEHAPGAVEGQDVECGYLIVPERRDVPTDKTIKLGIVIIKSTGDNPAPDPLILAQGGPGGSGIELYARLAAPDNELGQMLRADRDLIAFEQRGTLYSRPFLFCQEAFDMNLEAMQLELSDEEELRLGREAYNACKARLEREDVDLAAYNSLENAQDIVDLAKVLGYDKINYYGVSYGTMLGGHLMRLNPDLPRAVILDGIVPLNVNPNQQVPVAKNRGFSQLFNACAADPDCGAAYPNLEEVFFDTVESLNQSPARVPLTDLETRTTYNAVFDGNDLTDFVVQLLYVTEAIPIIPKLIYDARDGDFDVLGILMGVFVFDRSNADGMYLSVMCAEDFDFQADELNLTGVRPEFAEEDEKDAGVMLQICADWGVPQLGPSADDAVFSDIPSLLYSGDFDPVTPPPYGDSVAQTLSRNYKYVFPANGHGAFLEGTCSTRIMRDFLNNPDAEPDANCVDDVPAPVFVTPANTLMAPGAVYLLRLAQSALSNPDPLAIARQASVLVPPVLVFFGMLLFPVVWLVGWLISLIRKAPRERRWPARIAPWLVVLLIILGIGFAGLQTFVVFKAFLGDLQGYVGIDRVFAWVYVFPLVMGAVTLGIVVLGVLAWIKGYWGMLARIYYSLTALLALIYVGLLANLGLMTVLLS